MGFIGKIFAVVMFPLAVLIVLEKLGIYSLSLPIDKVILGAIVMIVLQLLTVTMVNKTYGKHSVMSIATTIIFIGTAVLAICSVIFGFYAKEIPLILAIMMLVEALYALH